MARITTFVTKCCHILAVFIAAMSLGLGVAQAQDRHNKASVAKELEAKAAASGGTVRVIVELNIPWQPEGRLVDPDKVENSIDIVNQRASIARAQDDVLNALARANVSSVKRFEYTPQMAMEVDKAGLAELVRSPMVLRIEEDMLARPNLWQSIPLIQGNTSNGFPGGFTGSGQAIAILDTGVQKTHPFVSGKVVSEACYSTTSAPSSATSVCPGGSDSTAPGSGVNCPLSIDGCDHGTHVAGIAAGKTTTVSGSVQSGVAKNASIISIQVFSSINSTSFCGAGNAPCTGSFASDQIQGLQRVYALRNTFRIAAANMSLGGGSSSGFCDTDSRKATIDLLRNARIATTISSGNDGFNNATGAPGCISSAITVGCTSKSDSICSFSNNSQTIVDLLAPGLSIRSSIPNNAYAFFSGTSMSAPHVAGAWAILKEKNNLLSVSSAENILESTGKVRSVTRGGVSFSKPRIQVADALLQVPEPRCTVSGTMVSVTASGSLFGPNHFIYLRAFNTSNVYWFGTTADAEIATQAAKAVANGTRVTMTGEANCPTSGTGRSIGNVLSLNLNP